ncbi:MAG: hypothetical protein L0216_11410 [Planctomycetales bacterium]|nr:hypothetical protein [Planctomycetales bacterium]
MNSTRLRILGAVVLLAGLVVLIERLWVTDTEAIAAEIAGSRAALLAGDVDGAARILSDRFTWERGGRAQAVASVRGFLKEFPIHEARGSDLESVAFEESGEGVARVDWVLFSKGTGAGLDRMPIRLFLRFAKEPEGWRVVKLERWQWGAEALLGPPEGR